MFPNGEKWGRIFTIPETSKHKKGFTIYKVVSMLYPESCPDAITKLTVWKRYNDFKKLHKEMKTLYKTLHLKDNFPTLRNTSFFKRFDECVIQQRKQSVLDFLEYVGGHHELFTSTECVHFFKTSHMPSDLDGNINAIRAELRLPSDPEYLSFHAQNSDDERTFSDTDSISTMSSFSTSVQISDILVDPSFRSTSITRLVSNREDSRIPSWKTDSSDSISSSTKTDSVIDVQFYPTPPNTPGSLEGNCQYIVDASFHINAAVEFEKNNSFEEAFSAYKTGIDILLKHVKGVDVVSKTGVEFKLLFHTLVHTLVHTKVPDPVLSVLILHFYRASSLQPVMLVTGRIHKSLSTIKNCVLSKMCWKFLLLCRKRSANVNARRRSQILKEQTNRLLGESDIDYELEERNLERRTMVRHKTEKYLLRAEKIYNMHLSPEMKCVRELAIVEEPPHVERPLSDLHKYKVVRIICTGMLVLHSELQKLFFVKAIQKASDYRRENLIFPENVPYMVKLENYYECENIIFLVLEYCSGTRLWDFIKKGDEHNAIGQNKSIIVEETEEVESDNESVLSYSDLIMDYQSKKNQFDSIYDKKTSGESQCVQDLDVASGVLEEDNKSDDLVSLDTLVFENNVGYEFVEEEDRRKIFSSQRSISDRSFFEEFDEADRVVVPIKNVVKWAAQLLVALEKLHELDVICCDLHASNLLIDDKGDLVLTYMCKVNENCDKFVDRNIEYMAPECYGFDALSRAVDWWSYGTILYELLVGMPLEKIHPEGLQTYTTLKLPKYVSAEGRSLLKQLLTCESHNRLGCGINGVEDLKMHPFFSSVSWDSLDPK